MKIRYLLLDTIVGKILLVLLGLVMVFVLAEALLRINPNLVPSEVRVYPPARRVRAFRDEIYEVKLSDNDLFFWMQGAIRPIQPDQDKVLARVHFSTDAQGFRNSLPEKMTYDMIALGASLTEASNVATPWPQQLAEITGTDMFNLGDATFPPQQAVEVLQQYGMNKQPQWVILEYFEGDDLHSAAANAQAQPFIVLRLGKHLLTRSLAVWNRSELDKSSGSTVTTDDTSLSIDQAYRYPITITTADTKLEMAFFSNYVAWLSASRAGIEPSRNYQLVKETILHARELSEAAGARFLLVYIPSKPHVYLPYVNDVETLKRVFEDVQVVGLNEVGFLEFFDQAATPELLRQHMDDQAGLLADFAAEQDIAFLDLTPHFQAEADTGAELYYPYDTHWNQRGHDLAAQVIAKYMGDMLTNISE